MKYILSIIVLAVLIFFSSLLNGYESNLEIATFAGGCFWCIEHPFEALDGVDAVISGYATASPFSHQRG